MAVGRTGLNSGPNFYDQTIRAIRLPGFAIQAACFVGVLNKYAAWGQSKKWEPSRSITAVAVRVSSAASLNTRGTPPSGAPREFAAAAAIDAPGPGRGPSTAENNDGTIFPWRPVMILPGAAGGSNAGSSVLPNSCPIGAPEWSTAVGPTPGADRAWVLNIAKTTDQAFQPAPGSQSLCGRLSFSPVGVP